MADLAKQISDAKQQGYSDDDIVGYLGTSHPELGSKIKEAQSQGYGAGDIVAHLGNASAPAAAPPNSPTVGGFLSNAVGSAGRFVGDIAGAVTHPGRTLEGVTGLLEGMAEKSGFKPVAGVSHQQNVDALVKLYKDRYGSVDGFSHALYTDPVGVLADVATLAGGVGAAGKGVQLAADAAKLTKVADVAGTVAKGAEAVSGVTDPLKLAGKAATATGVPALVGKGADALANSFTKDALRGGHTINTPAADVAQAVEAARAGNIPFSPTGIQKISTALGDLRQQTIDLVSKATAGGAAIDPKKVKLRLDDLRDRYAIQVNSDQDLKDIDKVGANFDRNFPSPMGADDAQMLKVGSNALNADKYGKASVAQIEAEKALTRGLKEELELQIPELKEMNAKQAQLIGLDQILGKAVNKYVNGGGFTGNLKKELFTKEGAIKSAAVAGTAGYVSGNPVLGGTLAFAQAVLSDPAVKQRLAIAINQAQQLNPGKYGSPSMATALSRVNEYTTSLNSNQQ